MEVVVSCCVGLLCATCAFGALGVAGDSAAGLVRPRPQSGRELLLGCAGAVGAGIGSWGLIPPAAITALEGEVRRMSVPILGSLDAVRRDEALGLVALASAAAALLLPVLTGSSLGILAGCVAPSALIAVRSTMRARAERSRVAEAMPEAFGALAVSLGSGLSLAQAMRYVGSHAEEPVRSEFMRVAFSITCGIPAAEALDAMIERLRAPGLELVTLALKVSQRTGAPLKDLLSDAAKLVGERIELARRLDVKTSQARMSAQLVACMPMGMTALLSLLSSDFRKGLATVPGALSIAVALVMNAAAWMIIRRIMRVKL